MGTLNLQELLAEIVEHVRGMWRYRWWAAGVSWVLALAGWYFVATIPDSYRASAKVFVDTHSLLRPLMQGLAVDSNTMNEVQLVSTAIRTRPNLERVAYETDLALRAETPQEMEELVTRLQREIQVRGGVDNVFTIEFEDVSREKAQDVVAAVVDAFIEGAIVNQGSDAEVTEQALANEIEVHERRLRQAEESLARFKQENLGYMPGEFTDYYSRLQAAVARVAGTEEKVAQVAERRQELERQLEGEAPVFGVMQAPTAAAGCSRGGQIAQLRNELAALRLDFTEKHPRVVGLEETLAYLEQECQAEAQRSLGSSPAALQDGAQALDLNPVYQNLRIQLSTASVELAELRSRLSSDEEEVSRLRRDVDKITEVETQLKQLNRDYDVVQARHQELIRRWEDLQAKKRLDPVTDDVQFRRLEPPFAGADPVGPNRPPMFALVLLAALGAGGALAFGLNQLNWVYFTRVGLAKAVAFPVLGSVGRILTAESLARRRLDRMAWAATVSLLVLSAAAVIMLVRPNSPLSTLLAGWL